MSIGTFTLIKDEILWVKGYLTHHLAHLDQMVLFDGNSTDGTLETIKEVKKSHPDGYKIVLKEGKDPEDLRDAYVEMFNDCMWTLETDWAWFLHPDMRVDNPQDIKACLKNDGVAQFVTMRSFAGEPYDDIYEFTTGRTDRWKNIYRLRPDYGAHYHGWYGAADEDVYFSKITGDSHDFYRDLDEYPYEVSDSGLTVLHYSDVRPFERRVERMERCLINQGYPEEMAKELALKHPRVTLESGMGFTLKKMEGLSA